MSNFTDFIGGGGGGSLPVNIVLSTSQTWVPPADGNVCIHVIGAGGAGNSGTDSYQSAGAGGYCKKNSLAVTTSGSFTVVVGVGKKGIGGDYGSNAAGAGGNSTVAGTGLSATLTANGGQGGSGSTMGAGGTASGGDVNNTGGAGGSYGGGAVGIYGTGNEGGTWYRAGSCDAQGPESLIGHGYICGGLGGFRNTPASGDAGACLPLDGGFLSGGGMIYTYAAQKNPTGGTGGIGGGGGAVRNASGGNISGGGGDGIVIIQYLPA